MGTEILKGPADWFFFKVTNATKPEIDEVAKYLETNQGMQDLFVKRQPLTTKENSAEIFKDGKKYGYAVTFNDREWRFENRERFISSVMLSLKKILREKSHMYSKLMLNA